MHHKLLTLDQVNVKFSDSTEPHKFVGYASVFNNVDAVGDIVLPGAFKNTIQERGNRPVRMRWNHFGPVIGLWKFIEEDEIGLRVEGELTPGHSVAENVAASLKHGAVDGMSIGYRVLDSEERGGTTLLKEIELVEISVVEEPANDMALVSGFKSAVNDATSLKEIEGLLRDAGGFSKSQATALVGRVRCLLLGDQGGSDELNQIKQLIANRKI